jgi:NAD(P)H-nitrite reductase large subunit
MESRGDGAIVCHCFRLTREGLRRLLETHRCATVEDVAERTGACRGCQTCRPDIEAILRGERKGEGSR